MTVVAQVAARIAGQWIYARTAERSAQDARVIIVTTVSACLVLECAAIVPKKFTDMTTLGRINEMNEFTLIDLGLFLLGFVFYGAGYFLSILAES